MDAMSGMKNFFMGMSENTEGSEPDDTLPAENCSKTFMFWASMTTRRSSERGGRDVWT